MAVFTHDKYGPIRDEKGTYVVNYENLSKSDQQYLKDTLAKKIEAMDIQTLPFFLVPYFTLLEKRKWYENDLYVYTWNVIIELLNERSNRKYILTPIPETGRLAIHGAYDILCVSFVY